MLGKNKTVFQYLRMLNVIKEKHMETYNKNHLQNGKFGDNF
jgi:hypothetical protein